MRFKFKKDWLWTHQVQVLCYILSFFSEQSLHLFALRMLLKLEPDFPSPPHVPQSLWGDRWILVTHYSLQIIFPSFSFSSPNIFQVYNIRFYSFKPFVAVTYPTFTDGSSPLLLTSLCVTWTSHNSFIQCSSLLWYSLL